MAATDALAPMRALSRISSRSRSRARSAPGDAAISVMVRIRYVPSRMRTSWRASGS